MLFSAPALLKIQETNVLAAHVKMAVPAVMHSTSSGALVTADTKAPFVKLVGDCSANDLLFVILILLNDELCFSDSIVFCIYIPQIYSAGNVSVTSTFCNSFVKIMSVPAHPFLDPPVNMDVMRRLNDANTDTCLSLASTDMYKFSALSNGWIPEPQDVCWLQGLVIQTHVPNQLKASFTIRLTGHGLVCDNSHIEMRVRLTKSPLCPVAGEFTTCTLSGIDHGGLTTCVAKCLCDGKDCKHATVHIPKMHEDWKICEITLE